MRKYTFGWMLAFIVVLGLAGCTPAAPAAPTVAVEPTVAATATTAATATVAPSVTPEATAEPTAEPTTEPTAEPTAAARGEMPDVQADPMAALLYASSADTLRSAEFEYEMSMTMEPADDAATEALSEAVEVLKAFEMSATGSGAMEVLDPQGLNNKMRMQLEMKAAGQEMQLEMVMIEGVVWARTGADEEWQKSEVDPAESTVPGGLDPNDMLESFQNATDVEWVEDTELNGEPVSHLRFTVDPSKFDLSSLTGTLGEGSSSEEIEQIMQDMTIEANVWLAKDDLQLRQQQMLISLIMSMERQVGNPDARLRMNIDTTMRMLSVNEPVTIEPPTE